MRDLLPKPPILRLPNLVRQAMGLLLINSVVRALGALAALGIAYHAGTGLDMDYYMALNLIVATFAGVSSSAVPALASQRAIAGEQPGLLLHRCWPWVRKIQGAGMLFLFLGAPLLVLWLTPAAEQASPWKLAGMLLLAAPSALLAPSVALLQTALQVSGRPYAASGTTLLSTGLCLVSAIAAAQLDSIYVAAAGISVGALLEYWALRLLTGSAPRRSAAHSSEPFPWKGVLSLTGASSAVLLCGFLDQALLAQTGAGAQALWGLASRAPSFLSLSIFVVAGALSSALLPKWRQQGGEKALVAGSLKLFLAILAGNALAMAAIAALAHPMTTILYERGAFGPDDTVKVSAVTQAGVWAYLLYPASAVMVRACGVLAANRALILSAVAFVVGKLVFTPPMVASFHAAGVAYSTLIAALAQTAVMAAALWVARNKAG